MKTLLTIGTSLTLLMGISAFAFNQADVVREDQGCTFFDGNGDPIAVDCTVQRVYTNNEKGTFNLWGKAHLPEDAVLPERAMHFGFDNTGFTCEGSSTGLDAGPFQGGLDAGGVSAPLGKHSDQRSFERESSPATKNARRMAFPRPRCCSRIGDS